MAIKPSFYKGGSHNAICDRCGFKFKAEELRETWNGLRVCLQDWEPRQPQDFVRGVPEQHALQWTRPQPQDNYVEVNYISNTIGTQT